MTKSLFHKPEVNKALLGIRFRPGYSIAFVKDDMSKYSDNKVDLSLIIKKNFNEVIDKYFEKDQTILNSLEDTISDLFKNFKMDFYVNYSIALIKKYSGNIRIGALSQNIGLSRRSLEKNLKNILEKLPNGLLKLNALMHF